VKRAFLVNMLAFWVGLFCAPAYSNDAISPAVSSMSSIASIGKLVATTIFVLLLFFAFAKLMKRLQLGARGSDVGLNVVSVLSLGQRERIVVVQAGEEQLLLGVTSTQITTLHVLETPLKKLDMVDTDSPSASGPSAKM